MEQAKAWQSRPPEAFYAVIFLDAVFVKMRHEGRVEIAPCLWRWESTWKGRKKFWGFGPERAKAPGSG
jgi:transposase-like protein